MSPSPSLFICRRRKRAVRKPKVSPRRWNYFENRARRLEQELRELFRIGWRSLAIGTTVLVLCLAASQLVGRLMPNPTTARIVEESFILVGWVANWRPIEIYLYDWWPVRRRLRLYRHIAKAPVTVNAT